MKEKFIVGFIEGYTTMELCNRYNLTGDEVCEFFKELSVEDFKKHQVRLCSRIIELYNKGYSSSAIAAKTFVARSIVSKVLAKFS